MKKTQSAFFQLRIAQLEAVAKVAAASGDREGWLYFAARRNAYLFAAMPNWQFAVILNTIR